MTLDEAIKHAEEVAKQNEEDAVIYSNCKNHKQNLYEIGLAENAEKKCRKCAEEHRQLAEWLKELKQLREQTRWISCNERLPKDEEEVIVSIHDDSGDYTLDYSSSGWYACAGDFWVVDNEANERVAAWMPLPEPAKIGDEQDE